MNIEQLLARLSYHPQRKVRFVVDGHAANVSKIELEPDGSVLVDIKTRKTK